MRFAFVIVLLLLACSRPSQRTPDAPPQGGYNWTRDFTIGSLRADDDPVRATLVSTENGSRPDAVEETEGFLKPEDDLLYTATSVKNGVTSSRRERYRFDGKAFVLTN